jgi:hypothetical protein
MRARLASRDFHSIEELYQSFKRFADGTTGLSVREAKGRKAENQEECAVFYDQLWREYLLENPYLVSILLTATGISDQFGQPGRCCQASVLWSIRNEYLTTPPWKV